MENDNLQGVFAAEDCWYIVLELASGGELYECLTTEGALEKWEVRGLLREMAGAVAHIHSRGVVHGDIKPENLLLREPPKKRKGMAMESEGGYGYGGPEKVQKVSGVSAAPVAEDLTYSTGVSRCSSGNNIGETAEKWEGRETASTSGKVLLADFGSSFRVNAGEGGGERDGVREGPRAAKEYTAAYSAPEVVSEGSLDQKADVWSLGVIAYVMVRKDALRVFVSYLKKIIQEKLCFREWYRRHSVIGCVFCRAVVTEMYVVASWVHLTFCAVGDGSSVKCCV